MLKVKSLLTLDAAKSIIAEMKCNAVFDLGGSPAADEMAQKLEHRNRCQSECESHCFTLELVILNIKILNF